MYLRLTLLKFCLQNYNKNLNYANLFFVFHIQIHILQVNRDTIECTEEIHAHAAVMLMQVLAGRRIEIHLLHAYRLITNHKRCIGQEQHLHVVNLSIGERGNRIFLRRVAGLGGELMIISAV